MSLAFVATLVAGAGEDIGGWRDLDHLPPLHQMSAGIVGNDGMRHAVPAQFIGRQRRNRNYRHSRARRSQLTENTCFHNRLRAG